MLNVDHIYLSLEGIMVGRLCLKIKEEVINNYEVDVIWGCVLDIQDFLPQLGHLASTMPAAATKGL